jgi:5-methyltetrahydropteroyltriglutamate--homocysteine methyltransferase
MNTTKMRRELIKDLAEILREEIIEVVNAGCKLIQIDEPVWVGYPEDLPWLVEIFNWMIDGIDAKFCLHVCYGNYQLKRLFKGQYADLFPALLDVNAHQLSLEFAVNNAEPLELFKKYGTRNKEIVVGVIDVKDPNVETPEIVAQRIRKVFDVIPPENVWLSPDCGMKFMPRNRAFAKLCAMTQAAEIVRNEISN